MGRRWHAVLFGLVAGELSPAPRHLEGIIPHKFLICLSLWSWLTNSSLHCGFFATLGVRKARSDRYLAVHPRITRF